MRQKIVKLLGSDLIQSSFYSAVATLVKVITAFLMSKIIAIYLGPAGLGLIGQLTNFVTVALVVAGGALSNGVVKYVAEYNVKSPQQIAPFLSTAFKTTLLLGATTGLLLCICSKWLSIWILKDVSRQYIFWMFGFTIIFYGLNSLLISIVNGYKEFRKFNMVNILTSVVGLAFSYVCILLNHVDGAFIAIVINQSIIFFITLICFRNEAWLNIRQFLKPMQLVFLKNLSRYILMTLVTTITIPMAQILIRSYIIKHLTLDSAGLWESVSRISNIYLMFVTTTLATYYLPRLSEIEEPAVLRHEVVKVFKIVVPLVTLAAIVLILLRSFILRVLFSEQFTDAGNLFVGQAIGDVFKVMSWLLSFLMIARAMTRNFIFTELTFSVTFVLLSVVGIKQFGLIGATYAYATTYLLYFFLMLLIFRRMIFSTKTLSHE